MRRKGWPVILGLPLLAAGCQPTGEADSPHVLLITLDTARFDRFSYAGPSPVRTPNVDGLASEGTAFLQAVSPAPITLVAHASLFTGLVPTVHGVRNNGTYRLTDEANTIGEMLESRGYGTAAFVGAAVLDARYGLDQGFALYDDSMTDRPGSEFEPQRRAEAVVDSALRWIERNRDSPTFAWVHLFDPHMPYDPPEPERSRYPDAPYDGEIAYSDRMIGRLLDGYRRLGLYDRTIVVFTSDHGESLGEHGELTHGIFLFDATVRVPLIVRVPDLGAGLRVESQVSLIDVVPTLISVLGLSPEQELDGRSLLPLMRGEPVLAPPAYLETRLPLENHDWFFLRGLRSASMKLISGTTAELYDLEADPEEASNIAGVRGDTVSSLLQTLEDGFPERETSLSTPMALNATTHRQLTALGYISTSEASPSQVPSLARYERKRARLTLELYDRGFREVAHRRCREIASSHAPSEDCIDRLRELLHTERAISQDGPDRTQREGRIVVAALLAEAEAAALGGDPGSVRQSLSALTGIFPHAGGGTDTGGAARPTGRSSAILETAAALSRIGTACFEHLSYENAVHAYLIGSRLVPDDPSFHYNLGLTWERLGDVHEALLAFDRTIALDPGFARAEAHRRYVAAVLARLEPRAGP